MDIKSDMTRVRGWKKPVTTGMPLYTGYQDNIGSGCSITMHYHEYRQTAHNSTFLDGNLYCFSPDGRFCGRYNLTTAGAFVGCSEAAAGDLNNDGIRRSSSALIRLKMESLIWYFKQRWKLLHRVPLEKGDQWLHPAIADVVMMEFWR